MRGREEDEGVEIDLMLHRATEKAVLVSLDDNSDNASWVPKSQILDGKFVVGTVCTLTLKAWIAEREGLI